MKIKSIVLSTLILGALPALAGSPSYAESLGTVTTASPWSLRMGLYGWAESFDGDVGIRNHVMPVDIAFDDLIKDLDFAFMGVMEIGYNRWGLLADVNYAMVSESGSRGPLWVKVQEDQFVGNFFVTYEAMKTESCKLDLFAGVRVNSIKIELDIDLDIDRQRQFSGSSTETWVDPVIGARFNTELSDGFFFRALGDIGGFGAASDLTWQTMAGFGYEFKGAGSLLLAYRAIGTDYKNGGFTYNVIACGPLIGYEYKF